MPCCFCIGHRDTPESVFPTLCETIEHHILAHGVNEFLVGHYGNFDRLVALALSKALIHHPSVHIYLLTPYHPAERSVALPPQFQGTIYPPGMESVPRRYAIVHANRYAVDYSDYLITHLSYSPSNAANIIRYACKKHKHITMV